VSPPDADELARLYREDYHRSGHLRGDPSAQRIERRRVVEQVAGVVASTRGRSERGLVVELGAGWGGLGEELTRRGLPYLGIEPNEEMAAHARSRGLRVVTGDVDRLEEATSGEAVHTFVSTAVFEHLRHPSDVLRRQAALLEPAGAIVIQAPVAGLPRTVGRLISLLSPGRELPELFGCLAPPWHVLLPTPRSMRTQASACGLRLERVLASRSGRRRDARRWLQLASEKVGQAGHAVFGERWPLTVAHIYVLSR
jgi:hypothetical protein